MTPLEVVPPEVFQFIDRFIDSIEQLEVLLMLWRANGASLDPGAITRELGSNVESIVKRLANLALNGLSEEENGGFRYRADPHHEAVVIALARSYHERRVSIITYIINNPNKSLRAFSDAFRLRDPRST